MYSLYRRHLGQIGTAKCGANTPSATTITTASPPSTISAAVDSASAGALQEEQHAARHTEAPAITVTAASVSSYPTSSHAPVTHAPPPPASSPPLSTIQILLSPRGGGLGGMGESSINHTGILPPPAVSLSPPPPQPQPQPKSHSDMVKPRPLTSASYKQTVFDGEGVFTITRSPSVVSQQPSCTVLPHQPNDDDHDLHNNNNNNNNNNNKEVSEKYHLGLGSGSLQDGSKGDTTTTTAAGVAAALGGGAVVASTAAAAASAANEPCNAYMRRVCCEALCDPLCLLCCLTCNADCCPLCGNMDLCCLLCQICTRL